MNAVTSVIDDAVAVVVAGAGNNRAGSIRVNGAVVAGITVGVVAQAASARAGRTRRARVMRCMLVPGMKWLAEPQITAQLNSAPDEPAEPCGRQSQSASCPEQSASIAMCRHTRDQFL